MSIINGELCFVINDKPVISINFPKIVSIENRILSVSSYLVEPRITLNLKSIIAGPVTFDPEFMYCGSAQSSLEGFSKMRSSGIDLDSLSQSLISSYVYMAIASLDFTNGSMFWSINPPLVSFFELTYLYNECENIGVDNLNEFIQELRKKIGKKNEGTLKAYNSKLHRGKPALNEVQSPNNELRSKISELKVALRYSQCGYDVVYNGGMSHGGSDLIVIKGSRETKVEVKTRFNAPKDFYLNTNSKFPQNKIIVKDTIGISFSSNEEKNINEKFNQGDIVVQDITGDYKFGTTLSARNSFFQMKICEGCACRSR